MTEILTGDGVMPNYIIYANAQRKSGLSRTHFRRLARERNSKGCNRAGCAPMIDRKC